MKHEVSAVDRGLQLLDADTSLPQTPEPATVGDIMQCGVITIRPESPACEAVNLLVGNDISGLPVVDDSGLVGVISEKDILKLVAGAEPLAGTVGDLMTQDVVTCDEETSIVNICACLAAHSFRHVPVVRARKLVGIISRSDLIRACKDRFRPDDTYAESPADVDGPVARDVMTYGLLTVGSETPIYQAMDILARWDITGLPVVDDYLSLIGIVSEKDMLRALCNPDVGPACVGALMTKEVVSFQEGTPLLDICDCLARSDFRRVPILNQGKLTGIVSRRDLIVYLLKNRSQTATWRTAEAGTLQD